MEPLYFKSRNEWHDWLLKNHDKVDEVWLLYYKKHTSVPNISYNDAVEEALAFGWIDGKVMTIDDKKYKQRYTPRRKGSVWSVTNLERVKKLMSEGRIQEAGLKAAQDVLSGKVKAEPGLGEDISMPKELENELKKDKIAWENFSNFPPSSKKIFYYWILNAKREETRSKRIKQTIKAALENNKIGYM